MTARDCHFLDMGWMWKAKCRKTFETVSMSSRKNDGGLEMSESSIGIYKNKTTKRWCFQISRVKRIANNSKL